MKTFDFNKQFIDSVLKDHLEKPFAIYCQLKQLHKNSTFYNYSLSSLHQQSGLSKHVLSKYIPKLISLGWAKENNGNLILTSFHKLNGKWKSNRISIVINGVWDYKEFITRLRLALIQKDDSQQQFVYNLSSNRFKTTLSTLKRKKKYITERHDKNTRTSYRRIAEQTHMSISSVCGFIKKNSDRIKLIEDKIILCVYNGCLDYSQQYNNTGFVMKENGCLLLHRGCILKYISQV